MSDLGYIILFLTLGAFLAVHCSRATVREWRAGQGLGGRWGAHDRETSPVGFWLVMAANAFAVMLGACFLIIGLVYLFVDLGWIS